MPVRRWVLLFEVVLHVGGHLVLMEYSVGGNGSLVGKFRHFFVHHAKLNRVVALRVASLVTHLDFCYLN